MAHYVRVPGRSILTPKVLALSDQIVRELEAAMKEKRPSRRRAVSLLARYAKALADGAVELAKQGTSCEAATTASHRD